MDKKPELSCDLCGDQKQLLLSPKCHLTAPLAAELDEQILTLLCYVPECLNEVARFKVVGLANSEQPEKFTAAEEVSAYKVPCPSCNFVNLRRVYDAPTQCDRCQQKIIVSDVTFQNSVNVIIRRIP